VGDNSVLKKCDIDNSIVMQGCMIDAKIDFSNSIISQGSEIKDHTDPKKHQFLLGERSQLKL